MSLAICVATMEPFDIWVPKHPGHIGKWVELSATVPDVRVRYNKPDDNLGVVGSYQHLYETTPDFEFLAYLHDDVICSEGGWDARVLQEFQDPSVGIVGFGGAISHGAPTLYKTPYRLPDLARYRYLSNVVDAEVHGDRFTDACDVAVLDGFALVVRREFLTRSGGWSVLAGGCDFFCYDYALCALARRFGYRVRLVGIGCHHLGGRTSLAAGEITGQAAYDQSHRWFYDTFRDVMPYHVQEPVR